MQLTTRCYNFNRQASLTQTQIQCKSMLALHTDNNTISHWWSINLCHMMISLSETDWFIIRTALTAQTVWAALVSFIPSDLQVRNWGDQNKAPVKTALTSSPETDRKSVYLQQNSTCVLLKRSTITTFWEKHWKSCHSLMQLPADLCTTATRPKSSQYS